MATLGAFQVSELAMLAEYMPNVVTLIIGGDPGALHGFGKMPTESGFIGRFQKLESLDLCCLDDSIG